MHWNPWRYFLLAVLLSLSACSEPATDGTEDQQTSPRETSGDGKGTGGGGGGGHGKGERRDCLDSIERLHDGELAWTRNNAQLLAHAQMQEIEVSPSTRRSAIAVSALLDDGAPYATVTIRSCGEKSLSLEKRQLDNNALYLVLAGGDRWKLVSRGSVGVPETLLRNVTELHTSGENTDSGEPVK